MINDLKKFIKLSLFKYFNLKISVSKKNIFNNDKFPDDEIISILKETKGIIHIGAHRGSERYICIKD